MSSYKVSDPSALKFLTANGAVVDENGNVVSDTSDYWQKVYDQAEPKPDKILHSDGTIKDAAGNLIQDTTSFNVKKYNQAEPIPAKYLHADGTIDENPGGGSGADLEDNHQETIDVSQYTEPVEITPSSGKDGMKKATITLSNIPSGITKLYAWSNNFDFAYTTTPTPNAGDVVILSSDNSSLIFTQQILDVTEEGIIIYKGLVYPRSSVDDIPLV